MASEIRELQNISPESCNSNFAAVPVLQGQQATGDAGYKRYDFRQEKGIGISIVKSCLKAFLCWNVCDGYSAFGKAVRARPCFCDMPPSNIIADKANEAFNKPGGRVIIREVVLWICNDKLFCRFAHKGRIILMFV